MGLGMRRKKKIGLLGGSFNPAHDGHVRITLSSLKRFKLDEVWWLVSPGNPLKDENPAPLHIRIQAARSLMRHPKVRISDIEARLGSRFTADTINSLMKIYPNHQFVWLMGADNLQQIDRWQNWRSIMHTLPVGVLARPGDQLAPVTARAARIYRSSRLSMSQSWKLGDMAAPAWCYINLPMSHMSSTKLRNPS